MELSFSQLRAKEVINTQDGRKLGKTCDIVLCYPENRWVGIIVPGNRGFCAKKNDLFIELKRIVKIGEDVILVNVGMPQKPCGRGDFSHGHSGTQPNPPNFSNGLSGNPQRNYEEFE
jgi:YlmC/YmxH family sporulation protein